MYGIISSFFSDLPYYLLGLPIILISLSFHEMSHAYAAYKLGDETARNFGRITMNPLKHIDPIGFICMAVFHFGWAKPVPVNSRNFEKPRRDMAITAAAGPISNIVLSIIFLLLLRLSMIGVGAYYGEELYSKIYANIVFETGLDIPASVRVVSVIIYMLYLGVFINLSLAIFNLIPINPLDGSRILHIFLPVKWYYWLMRYERYIYIALLVVVGLGFISGPLSFVTGWIGDGLFSLTKMPESELSILLSYVSYGLAR